MLLRLFGAGLALASAVPVPVSESMTWTNYPLVHQVDCNEGKGTAFRVGKNHWLSVAHVTALHECMIDGLPIAVTEQDGSNDFARLDSGVGAHNGIPVNCHGFIPGHWYFATGYAYGAPFQTTIALFATYAKDDDGKRVLIGRYDVIPGMSGGPIVDASGAVVGTVNAYVDGTPLSLSRELKDTSVCGANIA